MLTRRSFLRTALLLVLVGALLASMPVFSIAASMTPVFGPMQYTRSTGAPQTFTAAFQHCGAQKCQIVIVNGNASGKNRISSASISLNGTEIVGPSAFNQKVATIVQPVALAPQNQLITKLASEPGSYVTIDVECPTSPVILSLGGPGAGVPNPATLLSAVPIVNTGTAAALDVKATAITVPGETLSSPPLPSSLGTIAAGGSAILDADFSGGPFSSAGNPYPLTVKGTYAVDAATTYCFTLNTNLVVPPSAPGFASLNGVDIPSNSVINGNFPPVPPIMDMDVNPAFWTVPTAPPVPGIPTQQGTEAQAVIVGDPPAIVFDVNNGMGMTGAGQGCSGDAKAVCAEPSGDVTGNGFVFATANWSAAYSKDESSFTLLNPTTIFPNDEVGYCCGQIVQYVPSIDRFIWILQGTGYRLAMASPADIAKYSGKAWTYWKLTPAFFGEKNASLDYPDLSVGNSYLYVSWDVIGVGLQVARIKLSEIAAGGTIHVEYTTPSDSSLAYGGHLTQDTGGEIFWAGHNGNTTLRVFSLAEGSSTYYWNDTGISSWANGTLTSTTPAPDSQDWLKKANGFPGHAVIGATRNGGQLWFAWTAGTDGNFPQPHVEMVQLDRNSNFNKLQQVQIWNGSHAFAYPALATNACTGKIGLSLEYGGNGNYENHVVGFWGDSPCTTRPTVTSARTVTETT